MTGGQDKRQSGIYNHDIDDALRSGVISMEDIPKTALELFGYSHRERINNMVTDLIKNSDGREEISQSPQFREELNKLRTFMFSHVYKSGRVKREEYLAKVEVVISSLYNYFLRDPSRLPDDLRQVAEEDGANAVSYTHLDVYKRQTKKSWRYIFVNISRT